MVAYFDFGFFASFLAGFFGICATSVGVDSTLVAPSATTAPTSASTTTAAVAAPGLHDLRRTTDSSKSDRAQISHAPICIAVVLFLTYDDELLVAK